MRIWSLHPRFLDGKGLVACWREALLAQAVLAGRTTGYTHHPQLRRFRGTPDPLAAIGAYLEGLAAEATRRGYHFDASRIIRRSAVGEQEGGPRDPWPVMEVTTGQLALERRHLSEKLRRRSPGDLARLEAVGGDGVDPHPLFHRVPGGVADWERAGDGGR